MSTNTNALFGRKWKLSVMGPAGAPLASQTQQKLVISSDDLDQPLRVTFDIVTVWYQWFWQAEIKIYNLSQDSTQWLLSQGGTTQGTSGPTVGNQSPPIQQGMRVILEAGYQSPGMYGVIWDGLVLQPLFDRINSVDFVVTLRCVIGLNEITKNFINQVYTELDPLAMVQKMASDCFHPITLGRVAPTLANQNTLSYPKVVFGNPGKHFTEMVRSANMQWWLDGRGFNVGDLVKEFPSTAKYTFTPPGGTTGIPSIIGTPVQTQFGVNCRLLLNPNVVVSNPPMAIKIDNAVIQQLARQIGDISSIGILAQDGTYGVVGARYLGDTRGQDWYTDVTGWLGTGYLAALAAFGSGSNQVPQLGQQ